MRQHLLPLATISIDKQRAIVSGFETLQKYKKTETRCYSISCHLQQFQYSIILNLQAAILGSKQQFQSE